MKREYETYIETQRRGKEAERFIPSAVTELLASPWQDKTGCTEEIAKAYYPNKTSCYIIHREYDETNLTIAAFTYAEAKALLNAGAFGCGAILKDDCVIVDENASHSLQEFLGAVTRAWREHLTRLEKFASPPSM